jgi:hypothetical protein
VLVLGETVLMLVINQLTVLGFPFPTGVLEHAGSGSSTTDHGPRTTDHGQRTTDHGPRTTHN